MDSIRDTIRRSLLESVLSEAARLKKSARKIQQALMTKPAKLKQWEFEFTLTQVIRATQAGNALADREHHLIVQAAEGVSWAYSSGRLPGEQHLKLRRMNGFDTIVLIGEIADKGLLMNAVPGYLIKNL